MAWAALGKVALGVVKGGAAKKAALSAAKGMAVEKTKKIAKDKLLNRKKKTGKRREAAQKMMGGEEGGGGEQKGGALAVIPKTPLIKSPTSSIEKYSGEDEKKSGGSEGLEQAVLQLKTSVIQVEKLLGNSVALQKKQIDDKRKAREAAETGKAEADLEKKKPKGIKLKGPKIKMPGKGILGSIMDFVSNIIFGWVMVRMVDWMPKLAKLLPILGAIFDGYIAYAGFILKSLGTLIDWGYKLVQLGKGLVTSVFGEEGAKKFDTFMTNIKDLISGFLVWKLIGEKIFKAIVQNIRNTWKVIRGVFAKAGKFLNWMTGGRAGNLAKNVLSKGKGVITKVGGAIGKRLGLGGVKKLGGSLMKKGAGGLLKRGALKIFGKAFVKVAGKIFGRVPIIGPVIVGIVSLISGEPLGQAVFKTLGAAVGGLLGTFIPIPVVGTLLGEAVGVFVGDLLYHLIVKRDPKAAFQMLKNTVMGIFKGGKAIVDWLIGGGLFELLKKGGGMLLKFGKWLFLDAIPWAAKKIAGVGKIIGEWIGSGVERWKSSFPMFKIPNVGIQDLVYKIFDATWPKWVTDLGIFGWKPFGHLEGKPILDWLAGERPEWLEGLPRLPRVLGWMWQHVPGLSALVDSDGEVKGFPKFWLLGNPLFMMSHTKNAFFPSQGSGKVSVPPDSGGSSGSMRKPAAVEKQERKEQEDPLKKERKKLKEKSKKLDEKYKKKLNNMQTAIGDFVIGVGDAMKIDVGGDVEGDKAPVINKTNDEMNNKIDSVSRETTYEENAPEVVEVPVVVNSGGGNSTQSSTVISGGSEGSGNDPYEALDFQG
jgi:hypothetical protein